MADPEWLTVEDVAPLLGLSAKNVYVMTSRGLIPHYRIGPNRGKIRFRRADIDDYIQGCRVGAPVAAPRPPARKAYIPRRDINKPGSPPRR